ncbi:MAG: hypothetical protein JW731_16010 [Bacteroidales bacterium]|nr:hypothetical protein [Bacteroidales bacterium]
MKAFKQVELKLERKIVYSYAFTLGFLSFFIILSPLFGQIESDTIRTNPEIKINVNKQYDENGNVIGYDSTYSWHWSGKNYNFNGFDSILDNLSFRIPHFDRNYFFNDSTGSAFFNDEWFYFPDFHFPRFNDSTGQFLDSLGMSLNDFFKLPGYNHNDLKQKLAPGDDFFDQFQQEHKDFIERFRKYQEEHQKLLDKYFNQSFENDSILQNIKQNSPFREKMSQVKVKWEKFRPDCLSLYRCYEVHRRINSFPDCSILLSLPSV